MLLQTPSKWDDLPDNVPSVIKKIWGPPNGGYAPISNIDEYVDSAMEMIPKLREQILTLQIQLEQANALLAQVGNKSTNDHVPKTLEEALADYWRDNKQQRGD